MRRIETALTNGRALGNYNDLRAELERLDSPGLSSAVAPVVATEQMCVFTLGGWDETPVVRIRQFGRGASSFVQNRDGLDLDQGMLPDQPGDLNACSSRVRRSLEELPPHLSGPLVILEGEKVVGRLDDVVERGAGFLQNFLEFLEDDARLGDDVALADDLPVLVHRSRPGNEQQPSGSDGRRKRHPIGPAWRGDSFVDRHRRPFSVRRR